MFTYITSLLMYAYIYPLSLLRPFSFFHNYDDLSEDHQGRDSYNIFERAPTFACYVGLSPCRVCLMDNSQRHELLHPHLTHLGHYRAPSRAPCAGSHQLTMLPIVIYRRQSYCPNSSHPPPTPSPHVHLLHLSLYSCPARV